MTSPLLHRLRRGLRAPPAAVARWLLRQARAELDQHWAPSRARRLTTARLLRALGAESLDQLWARLADAPFPCHAEPVTAEAYEKACPGDGGRILADAEAALERRVDLLGSGPVALGRPIPWHRDFKSGHQWPIVPFRRLDLLDLGRPSDVKVPWELSRLQWLIPAGQAYLLTGDERYAEAARDVIEDWAAANPLARGVNWASTMDVALRGITLVWLFRVFHHAASWWDDGFRARFLKLLYLHGDFTRRHLEWADVNGNHLLADAAGLVAMGLFFGQALGPRAWQAEGWRILDAELPRQVAADGVDFEAAAAYQRLACELFLLPALWRRAAGLDVPEGYRDRVKRMADVIAHYSRADGSSPLWGDADDGRVLPFGGQAVGDHRYLVALIGIAFEDDALLDAASGPPAEVFWVLGPGAAERMPAAPRALESKAFSEGGVYVMRHHDGKKGDDHVFIDAGPVGFAGRGGHGHNDCLSFEAMLAGVPLVTDCGTYVYSADVQWRNSFRSTSFHNTPMVDGGEQNRFAASALLWTLRDDARPEVRRWEAGPDADTFVGAHSGFHRFAEPVTPVRAIRLEKETHRLLVVDRFQGEGEHMVRVPYHLSPGASLEEVGPGIWRIAADGRGFVLACWDARGWTASVGEGWVSPSYGVKHPAPVINFIREGPLQPLAIALMPVDSAPDDVSGWLVGEAAILAGPA